MRDPIAPEGLHEGHEAGHVVAASLLNIPYSYVTVATDLSAATQPHVWIDSPLLLGSRKVDFPILECYQPLVWPLAIFTLAGMTASVAYNPAYQALGPPFFAAMAENDIELIGDLFDAAGLGASESTHLVSDTVEFVFTEWPKIEAVAQALTRTLTLQYEQVENILAGVRAHSVPSAMTQSDLLSFVQCGLFLGSDRRGL